MTATEVRDILAAMQLIEEHGLSIYPQRSLADAMVEGWWCTAYDGAESWPIADSPIAAVRAWAEAAGVPWPKIEAVEMFALDGAIGVHVFKSMIEAECAAVRNICRYVPCVVVMQKEGE